jgi:DNA repair photolyase
LYSVNPPAVYVTEWAARDPRGAERIARLAAALGCPNPPVVSEAELAELATINGWYADYGSRTGETHRQGDPWFVLSGYETDAEALARRLDQYPTLRHSMLAGQGLNTLRDSRYHRKSEDGICQTAVELHCAYGCLHACQYCHIGSVFNVMTNLEALTDNLPRLWAENPWCRLWKLDNGTDTIVLEPEYGASELMVNYFAQQSEHYLLLYTKSDNVDHLLDFDPNGQTLISWSLAGPRGSELIEDKAPSMAARVEAMRKCQQGGYRVRARLSPICPLEGWQEEATALVEALFKEVKPELITMDVLGWMNARQMNEALDISQFDPRFRQYVEDQLETPPPPHHKHFFPHEMRREIMDYYLTEIRRLAPETPVSICMETTAMWRDMGPRLGMGPDDYACCCGPKSVPGEKYLAM